MNSVELLKHVIKQSPLSQNKVAAVYGITGASMSNRLQRMCAETDFVVHILGICGYDLVAVPKGATLPESSIVVESATPTAAQGYVSPRAGTGNLKPRKKDARDGK